MTISYINTGSNANAGDGDSLRTAFTKLNFNLIDLDGRALGTTATLNLIGNLLNNSQQTGISVTYSTQTQELSMFVGLGDFLFVGNTMTNTVVDQDIIINPNGDGKLRLVNSSLQFDDGAGNPYFGHLLYSGPDVGPVGLGVADDNSSLRIVGDLYSRGTLVDMGMYDGAFGFWQSKVYIDHLGNITNTGQIKSELGYRFPDNSVQTTAWTGGRVVNAPSFSTGAEGDRMGDIAFATEYFYYCTTNYVATPSTVSWTNVIEVNSETHYIQADIIDPAQLNGNLSITNIVVNGGQSTTEPVTAVELISSSTYKFFLENTSEPWNSLESSELQVFPNIWRRVAWNNDTW
jgi:hypothetical protein